MDDLAQFDSRRRPWRPNGEPAPAPWVSLQFKPVPPVALPERGRGEVVWTPRLGFGR